MASCSTVILRPWCVGIVDGPFQTEARRERTIPVPIARGFSLLLSPSLARAPTIHNPHHSLSFSLTLPRSSSSLLVTSAHAFALSLFSSLSNPHVDTIYLPFNRVSAVRFISQYSYLSVFPSFSQRISLLAPSTSHTVIPFSRSSFHHLCSSRY